MRSIKNTIRLSTNHIKIGVTSKEELKTSCAQLCKVYHANMHHHSYISTDCGIKLDQQIFSDSVVCKNMKCGKTKVRMLSANVLDPFSLERHLIELKRGRKSN